MARQCGVACASLVGEEEVLAFLHDLPQNHGDEGSTINQAVVFPHFGKKVGEDGKLSRPLIRLVLYLLSS